MLMKNEDVLNQARIWNAYANRGYLQSTIDPRDKKGLKCEYIDNWSRYYIKKFVVDVDGLSVLEIGCGSGRNLFALAPYVEKAYGIDIAMKQIENANNLRKKLQIGNVFFYKPENFFENCPNIHRIFTMWVLQHFKNDESLYKTLSIYCEKLPMVQRFVFFEQVSQSPYIVEEGGSFYKKIRTKDEYIKVLSKVGLNILEFYILNEKGFGPFYKLVYMSKLYKYWPKRLNINKILFFLDRHLVDRKIADVFTDCAFICERK